MKGCEKTMPKGIKTNNKETKTSTKPKIRRAKDPDQREKQLISLAIDCAEEQMRNGTASSAVITHFLKLGTEEYKNKNNKLLEENKMTKAKTEAIESTKRQEELYEKAIEAFKSYI